MSEQHDKTFVITFAGVLAFLIAFALVIYGIAHVLQASAYGDKATPAQLAKIDARTAPLGKVNTDPNAALAAAAEAAAAGSASLGPKEIVAQVCSGCHAAGVLGAPKIGDKGAWAAKGSLDSMLKNAISGIRSMPPRGGNPGLTDDQVRGAIQEMTK